MSTNVFSVYVSADVTISDNPIRIRGWVATNMGAAMSEFRIRDTTVAGTPLLSFSVAPSNTIHFDMPDFGQRVLTKAFVDVPTSGTMTLFYD